MASRAIQFGVFMPQITGDWREIAVKRHGIDLVLGHHPHVPQGVERVGNKVIFYSLGNFLHHGTADMAGKGICRDWGLLGRIHLVKGKGGRLELRAIEALPLDDMHRRARRLPAAEASARIHALNSLSRNLGGEGAEPVLFTPQADGRGLYCVPGAETESGPIGALCKDYVGAPETPAELRGRIAGSCGGRLTPRRETPEVATLTERAPRKLRRSGARSKAAARRKRVRVARSRSPVQLRRSSRGFDGAN